MGGEGGAGAGIGGVARAGGHRRHGHGAAFLAGLDLDAAVPVLNVGAERQVAAGGATAPDLKGRCDRALLARERTSAAWTAGSFVLLKQSVQLVVEGWPQGGVVVVVVMLQAAVQTGPAAGVEAPEFGL